MDDAVFHFGDVIAAQGGVNCLDNSLRVVFVDAGHEIGHDAGRFGVATKDVVKAVVPFEFARRDVPVPHARATDGEGKAKTLFAFTQTLCVAAQVLDIGESANPLSNASIAARGEAAHRDAAVLAIGAAEAVFDFKGTLGLGGAQASGVQQIHVFGVNLRKPAHTAR